jgi:hypothetical protein
MRQLAQFISTTIKNSRPVVLRFPARETLMNSNSNSLVALSDSSMIANATHAAKIVASQVTDMTPAWRSVSPSALLDRSSMKEIRSALMSAPLITGSLRDSIDAVRQLPTTMLTLKRRILSALRITFSMMNQRVAAVLAFILTQSELWTAKKFA